MDYRDSIKILSKVNNLTIPRNRQWREKKEELEAAQAEIARWVANCLKPPNFWDRAFSFGYGAKVLILRNRLLAAPTYINLTTLDLRLFSLGLNS